MKLQSILATLAVMAAAATFVAAQNATPQMMLEAARKTAVIDGDLRAAITQYQAIVDKYAKTDRSAAATALVRMAELYQKQGDAEARKVYERIAREFGDQKDAATEAQSRLAALQAPIVPARLAARQVWGGDGVDASGSPSPDGRYLSFTDWETGDLSIRDLVAGTSRRLTNTGGWEASGDYVQSSVISPDGRQVAYGWFAEKEFKNELRVKPLVPPDARARVVLRADRNDYFEPTAWTPDGARVIVRRALPDRTNQIAIVSVRTGSIQSLKSLEWRYPERISLSPDGRFVAYDAPAGANGSPRDIFVVAADGSRESVVVQSPANDTSPVWSPDGSQILFLSDRTGTYALWAIGVEDGKPAGQPSLLQSDTGSAFLLGISRKGTLYYLPRGSQRSNVLAAELDGGKASKPAVSATDRFINTNGSPEWSRDGRSFAYYSYRNSRANPPVLVVRSAASEEERTIPLPASVQVRFFGGPKWFPDDRSVLIVLNESEGGGIGFYQLHLDTGRADLVHRTARASSYALSPTGTAIFWSIQSVDGRENSGRLMRYDIDTRRETELKKDGWFIAVALSPDGNELAYLMQVANDPNRSCTIQVIPATGGPAREVYRRAHWYDGSRYGTLAWSGDRRYLLFAGPTPPNAPTETLWRVPASGGEAEATGVSLKGRIKSPALHPDGRRLLFTGFENDATAVWTLENFLPTRRKS